MKEYTFDLKLFATLTFEAESEEAARQMIANDLVFELTTACLGGYRYELDASIDGEPDLVDVVAV